MIDAFTKAAMAYLDEAQPKAEPWSYADAHEWGRNDPSREAKAFRAAMWAAEIS